MDQLKSLKAAQRWSICLDLVDRAWRCVVQLPVFDTSSHNEVRTASLQELALHCTEALKHANLTIDELKSWSLRYGESKMISDCCPAQNFHLFYRIKDRASVDSEMEACAQLAEKLIAEN